MLVRKFFGKILSGPGAAIFTFCSLMAISTFMSCGQNPHLIGEVQTEPEPVVVTPPIVTPPIVVPRVSYFDIDDIQVNPDPGTSATPARALVHTHGSDRPTYLFTIIAPQGGSYTSTLPSQPCGTDFTPRSQCEFVPDVEGDYTIRVQARDENNPTQEPRRATYTYHVNPIPISPPAPRVLGVNFRVSADPGRVNQASRIDAFMTEGNSTAVRYRYLLRAPGVAEGSETEPCGSGFLVQNFCNFTPAIAGDHQITVQAMDAAASPDDRTQIVSSGPRTYSVSAEPVPEVRRVTRASVEAAPGAQFLVEGSSVALVAEALDNTGAQSGNARYTFIIEDPNGRTFHPCRDTDVRICRFNINPAENVVGTYRVRVLAWDRNVNESEGVVTGGPSEFRIVALPTPTPAPAQTVTVVQRQEINHVNRCQVYSREFRGSNIPTADVSSLVLPYIGHGRHAFPVLQLGQGSPNQRISGTPFVRDAQVPFEIPVDLPVRSEFYSLVSAKLTLEIRKVSEPRNRRDRSEVLCLLDPRICSGTLVSGTQQDPMGFGPDRTYHANRNDDQGNSASNRAWATHPFFGSGGGRVVNQLFSDIITGLPQTPMQGNSMLWENENVEIDLMRMFHQERDDSGQPTAISHYQGDRNLVNEVLYRGNDSEFIGTHLVRKKLRFVVADDTMVKNPRLSVEIIKGPCSDAEIQAVAEAARRERASSQQLSGANGDSGAGSNSGARSSGSSELPQGQASAQPARSVLAILGLRPVDGDDSLANAITDFLQRKASERHSQDFNVRSSVPSLEQEIAIFTADSGNSCGERDGQPINANCAGAITRDLSVERLVLGAIYRVGSGRNQQHRLSLSGFDQSNQRFTRLVQVDLSAAEVRALSGSPPSSTLELQNRLMSALGESLARTTQQSPTEIILVPERPSSSASTDRQESDRGASGAAPTLSSPTGQTATPAVVTPVPASPAARTSDGGGGGGHVNNNPEGWGVASASTAAIGASTTRPAAPAATASRPSGTIARPEVAAPPNRRVVTPSAGGRRPAPLRRSPGPRPTRSVRPPEAEAVSPPTATVTITGGGLQPAPGANGTQR